LLFAAHSAPADDFVAALLLAIEALLLVSSDEYQFSLFLMLLSPELFGGPYKLPKLHGTLFDNITKYRNLRKQATSELKTNITHSIELTHVPFQMQNLP
jgi:hypothetical protein